MEMKYYLKEQDVHKRGLLLLCVNKVMRVRGLSLDPGRLKGRWIAILLSFTELTGAQRSTFQTGSPPALADWS